MSKASYHQLDLEAVLQLRNSRQLQRQFEIVDEKYPSGVFTHLEFGCASGNLLVEWLERYPRAQFIGIDLDIESKYAQDWPTLVRDHPNLKAILKADALNTDYIQSVFLQHFGQETVDIVHGHAAIMYLTDEKTTQFLRDASSYSQYIISRDVFTSDERFVGAQCTDAIRALEKCCKSLDSLWSEAIGRYVRPMTNHDTRHSNFTFEQFADYEIYTADSKPSLKDRMTTYREAATNLLKYSDSLGEDILHEHYNENGLAELLEAFNDFGRNGESCISHWVVTLLQNKETISR